MVLQRDVPLRIWGWAAPGQEVTVSFNGHESKTPADAKGNWLTVLPEQAAGGPYAMTVAAGGDTLTVNDILTGDVWLCSGQSNMELPLARVTDRFAHEIRTINNPYIRHFKTPTHRYSYEQPDDDLPPGGGQWLPATPEHIMQFSALAYFFAENLYNRYRIPIGLFNSSVGGSPAEAWISIQAAQQFPGYREALDTLIERSRTAAADAAAAAEAFRRTAESLPPDEGRGRWHRPDVDHSAWDEISLPGTWLEHDLDFGSGVLWLRREIDLPAALAGREATLRLGCIVNSDSAFINGQCVGNVTYQYPPRIYNVRRGLLREGRNLIAVRVVSHGRDGGWVVEKPYQLIVGDTVIDLTGQWKYKPGVDYAKHRPPSPPPPPPAGILRHTPTGLYNSMIAPVLNASFKGVIWYQGESNTNRAGEYRALLSGLIADWRQRFNHPQMPFLYVQLANFLKAHKSPDEKSRWAELREAQRHTLAVPHTGMAVAIDLGEWNDIHPLNKKELGRRLALEAQRVAYGETLVSRGPLYQSMEVQPNGSIHLTFTSTGSGLYTNLDLRGFALAGRDGRYLWANAIVIAPNRVKVWNPSVPNPVSVRYAWADNPDDANLKNKEGLPASPFCTDTDADATSTP
jgi:sialate O-acetylesterase